jgi:hypothetical protein
MRYNSKIWIFGITKSKITNVFMLLELTHQEKANSSIVSKIKVSTIPNLRIYIPERQILRSWGCWEQVLFKGYWQAFLNPGDVSWYEMIHRCRSSSSRVFFFLVASVVYLDWGTIKSMFTSTYHIKIFFSFPMTWVFLSITWKFFFFISYCLQRIFWAAKNEHIGKLAWRDCHLPSPHWIRKRFLAPDSILLKQGHSSIHGASGFGGSSCATNLHPYPVTVGCRRIVTENPRGSIIGCWSGWRPAVFYCHSFQSGTDRCTSRNNG